MPVQIKQEWEITGSLLKGWDFPVYRFIPGITQSEGLFIAVLRKKGAYTGHSISPSFARRYVQGNKLIHLLSDGNPQPEQRGKEKIPTTAQALSLNCTKDAYPYIELTLEQSQSYLHRETLFLPAGVPQGFVIVTYMKHPLGFIKNLGERANNLYPKNWAIRNL